MSLNKPTFEKSGAKGGFLSPRVEQNGGPFGRG